MSDSPNVISIDPLVRLARALADPAQPQTAFAAMERAAGELIGHRLFTLMIYHAEAAETERVYTNQPGPYPVGGRKRFADTPWSRRLLRDGTPYVGRTAADIREVFFDHELILSLGCASVLNVPVVWRGVVRGTMNLLHEERYYSDAMVPAGVALAGYLVAPYLTLGD